MLGAVRPVPPAQTESQYVSELRNTLEKIHTQARHTLKNSQRRQKRDYDLHVHQNKFELGDVVYMLNSATQVGKPKKLSPVYKGPYLVIKVISPVLIAVQDNRRQQVVHHDRLKHCPDAVLPRWLVRLRHPLLGAEPEPPHPNQEEENGELNLNISGIFEDPKLVDRPTKPDPPLENLNPIPIPAVPEHVVTSRCGRTIKPPTRLDI